MTVSSNRLVARHIDFTHGNLGDLYEALTRIISEDPRTKEAVIETAFSWPMQVAILEDEGTPVALYLAGMEEKLELGQPVPTVEVAQEPAATAFGMVPQVGEGVSAEAGATGAQDDPTKFDPDDEAATDALLEERYGKANDPGPIGDSVLTDEQVAEAEREAIEQQRQADEEEFEHNRSA